MKTTHPEAAASGPSSAGRDGLLAIPAGVVLDEQTRSLLDSVTKRLFAPFPEADIEWLLREDDVVRGADGGLRGRCFAYVTARAVQQRLDDIFGLHWNSEMLPANYGTGARAGMICKLTVSLPGIGVISKSDACDLTSVEPIKGGSSGALKRAGAQFGIGRYLYGLPEHHVALGESGPRRVRFESKIYQWTPPLLPEWALPEADRPARTLLFKELEAIEAEALKQRKAAADAAETLRKETEVKAAQALAETAKADAARISQAAAASAAPAAASPPALTTEDVVPFPAPASTSAPAAGPASTATTQAPQSAATAERPPTRVMAPVVPLAEQGKPGLSMGVVAELRDILGPDQRLAVAYLKHKKMLAATATSIEQLPAVHAMTLVGNKDNVKARMASLAPVAKLVGESYDHATTLFVGRQLVKADEPWFVASEDNLKSVIAKSGPFQTALAKMIAGQQQRAA